MKNFTRADAHNMYYWAFSWHISFSIIHSGDLLYDGLHMVRHLQVLQVIMLAIQYKLQMGRWTVLIRVFSEKLIWACWIWVKVLKVGLCPKKTRISLVLLSPLKILYSHITQVFEILYRHVTQVHEIFYTYVRQVYEIFHSLVIQVCLLCTKPSGWCRWAERDRK